MQPFENVESKEMHSRDIIVLLIHAYSSIFVDIWT